MFNAAKEQALDDFIAGRIGFTRMAPQVEATLEALSARPGFGHDPADLKTVLEWDRDLKLVRWDMASNRFGAVLENVVLEPTTRKPDFNDESKTENTRSAYPLPFIPNASPSGRGLPQSQPWP